MTPEQLKAEAIKLVIDTARIIREAPNGIPSGHLYAMMCDKCTLSQFHQFQALMIRTGLIEKRGDLLIATGARSQ